MENINNGARVPTNTLSLCSNFNVRQDVSHSRSQIEISSKPGNYNIPYKKANIESRGFKAYFAFLSPLSSPVFNFMRRLQNVYRKLKNYI